MSNNATEEVKRIEIHSARKALVFLKSKLAISNLSRSDAIITHVESAMLLALLEELNTPWTR